MKGEIVKNGMHFAVKWSDLHSFGHGYHYMETNIRDNNLQGNKVGDMVEFKLSNVKYDEMLVSVDEAVILNEGMPTLDPEPDTCKWIHFDDGQMGIEDWEYNTECGRYNVDVKQAAGDYCQFCGKKKELL